MSTLSVVRARKEISNSQACLAACRAVLYLLALPLLAGAWRAPTPPAAACEAAHQTDCIATMTTGRFGGLR
jgi:hypothetical protein